MNRDEITEDEAVEFLELFLAEPIARHVDEIIKLTCDNCKEIGPMLPGLNQNCPKLDENCEELKGIHRHWNLYYGKEAIAKAVEKLLKIRLPESGKPTTWQRNEIKSILRPYFLDLLNKKVAIPTNDKDKSFKKITPINVVIDILASVRKTPHAYYYGQIEGQRPRIEFVHPELYEPGLTWHIEPPKILDLPKYISIQGREAIQEKNVIGQNCGTCDYCQGILRYDKHRDRVCDECSSVFKDYVSAEIEPDVCDIDIDQTPREINTLQVKSFSKEADSDTSQEVKSISESRKLTKSDIISRRMETCCKELGCTIKQLDSSTVLQHAFAKIWKELYGEDMSKQAMRARIKAELKRQ